MIIFGPHLNVWAANILGEQFDGPAIGNELNGRLRAVVLYCGFSGKSCVMHIASEGQHWMTKGFLKAAFEFPFKNMGLKVILATVSATNEKSLRLSRHLGFQEVATIADAHNDGDLVILKMRSEDCKWI